MAHVNQLLVGVLGLGQIGGSLCAALSRQRYNVAAFDPNRNLREAAVACSIISSIHSDEQQLIETSDVVVLATHVDITVDLLQRHADSLRDKQLVFDVASVKSEICKKATDLGLHNFVGSHPIAGTERMPPDAWDADLFKSACFIYCPIDDATGMSVDLLLEVIDALDARAEKIKPEQNDYQFGLTIGLPHVFAYALRAMRLEIEARGTSCNSLIGPSYHSATRVAGSDPGMVEQMLWHDRRELVKHLERLESHLSLLRQSLEADDLAALSRFIRNK